MDNNFSYTVFNNDAQGQADREAQGFKGGNVSTDGLLIVGDLGSSEECVCTNHPLKPSYVEGCDGWPHLSHAEAKLLVNTEATSKGASDGWSFYEPLN